MTTAGRSREPTTLHQRIRADIEQRILNGEWRPGYRIPSEHELVAQYGCARMTVHKALGGLVDAGLIVRRRRAGSFVAQPRIQSVILDIPDIPADVATRGERYELQLLSRRIRKPRAASADEMQLAAGGNLLALRCLHLANGEPFGLEDRLISLVAVPDAASVDFAQIAPGTWLLDHVPWTEAEHRISAVNAELDVSSLLRIEAEAACLLLERRTWRGGEHITHVRQIFPGANYTLIARFAPAG